MIGDGIEGGYCRRPRAGLSTSWEVESVEGVEEWLGCSLKLLKIDRMGMWYSED
jgi:hypothetical protein